MSRLLRRLFALCVLSAGVFLCMGEPTYATPEECSTCDFNYYNCASQCDVSDDYCFSTCAWALLSCSNGCTPDGMSYRPPCPSSSGCTNYYNNCDTNCVAEKDVCSAQCAPDDSSCQNVCQSNINSCRAFCQAEFYDCLWCEN